MSVGPERQFLHAIASPLGTALLALDTYLADHPTPAGEEAEAFAKAHDALVRMRELLVARRQELIDLEAGDVG